MGQNSKIEWTTHTFNPWWGCEKVSPACAHCYAETWAKRCGADVWGAKADRRVFGEKHWNEPLKWNKLASKQRLAADGQVLRQWGTCETVGKPETLRVQFEIEESGFTGEMKPKEWEALKPFRPGVFCASMADVFEGRPDLQPERDRLWKLIEKTKALDWLLLTKRPENVLDMVPHEWVLHGFPANVWMGTTVEDQARADERVPLLLKIPAKVRFLSCEPLLGPVNLGSKTTGGCDALPVYRQAETVEMRCAITQRHLGTRTNQPPWRRHDGNMQPWIDWVICGGESGPGARPMHPDWTRGLRDQCQAAGVPFLFKQWGAYAPGYDEDRFTHGQGEKKHHVWMHSNGDSGHCWVRDEDLTWDNWTGEPATDGDGELVAEIAVMHPCAKKEAGRLLDGREWNEFPKV